MPEFPDHIGSNWQIRSALASPVIEVINGVRFFAAPASQGAKKDGEKGSKDPRMNEQIKEDLLRLVIDEKHSIVPTHVALQRARSFKMDLVESGVTLRKGECKEIRFTAKTELKDLKMKADTVKRLMERGYRVKCVAMGREGQDLEGLLSRLSDLIEDAAFVESGPEMESKQAHLIVRLIKFGGSKKSSKKAADATFTSDTQVVATSSGSESDLETGYDRSDEISVSSPAQGQGEQPTKVDPQSQLTIMGVKRNREQYSQNSTSRGPGMTGPGRFQDHRIPRPGNGTTPPNPRFPQYGNNQGQNPVNGMRPQPHGSIPSRIGASATPPKQVPGSPGVRSPPSTGFGIFSVPGNDPLKKQGPSIKDVLYSMDFDEYEYLEKTVENPEPQQTKHSVNGGEETVKSGDRDQSRSSKRRSREDDDDNRSRSRKSGDDSHDRDRHRERSSSHLSRSRDVDRSERDKERHRSSREHRDKDGESESRNGRERDHGRDKERERDRERERERGRGRDRDKEKDSDRDKIESTRERRREGGKEDEHERRSRSHSVKHQEDRAKSRDRDRREGEKECELRERDRDDRYARAITRWSFWQSSQALEVRHHKEKKEEAAEPEADPERDQRTVFAYQIALRADERDVYEFFSRAGKVRDVRLIMDRNSRRSKGVGYIEFYDVMSVPMAIALSGQPLLGQQVMVKPSEAEKNLVQSTSTAGGAGGLAGSYSGGGRRLYVGNLHYNITEEQLKQVFDPFGTVELVQLPLDETGHCKGFGFVQFSRLEDAKSAQNLNGQLEIAGRTIKVSIVTDQGASQEAGGNTGDFDDDEGGGLTLNARARAMLMQKLDRTGTASSIAGSLGTPVINNSLLAPTSAVPILGAPSSLVAPLTQATVPGLGGPSVSGLSVPAVSVPSVDTIGVPSECLLLKNMFDANLETEPDFDLDIKEDVQEECAKYGGLRHIYVDKNSSGFVYLRFERTQSAMRAQSALHGRFPKTTRLNSRTADRICRGHIFRNRIWDPRLSNVFEEGHPPPDHL
ncbi:RNA-binding protein 39-like protein [Drosera capensis]